MKTLLELEKEIPATVVAAGMHACEELTEPQVRSIYAAMRYAEQLAASRVNHPVTDLPQRKQ